MCRKRRAYDKEYLKALAIAARHFEAMSYEAASQLARDTSFPVELSGKTFDVEVNILERNPDYVQMALSLSGPPRRGGCPFRSEPVKGVIVYREARK